MILEEIRKAFAILTAPTPSEIKEALSRLAPSADALASCMPVPDGLPYGREVLFRTDDVEIVLIYLPPGHESAPHDHGSSFGWECVLQGELININHSVMPDYPHGSAFVNAQEATSVTSGQVYFIEKGQIHAIRNGGQTPVISLNVYSPPLSGCKQYCLPPDRPPSHADVSTNGAAP
ncbi:cysteine dioxygenase family protein [Brevibacillus borstelensis]|uniref:cysteine dioxygenase n=1 Tax=Brevibacillus borstelensis TaxID=45462 RepID=UPI0030BE3350